MPWRRVVAITGCDSGLGWAIAARSAREGLVTVAGMYNGTDTEAALALKNLSAYPYKLDVTDAKSVDAFKHNVTALLNDNPNYRLYALVNNAGVMTIGNYEWQTPQIIENTINVNLLGAMRTVTSFLPDLRKTSMECVKFTSPYWASVIVIYGPMPSSPDFEEETQCPAGTVKPRIINIASHCGLQPLPGFGPYSASKAGLLAWTKALRYENHEFGLKAVSFVPGGFINSSNLLASQSRYGKIMLGSLNEEQKLLFKDKISQLTNYLEQTCDDSKFDSLTDETILETFMQALMEDNPKPLYKIEPWRYKIYYNLFKLPFNEKIHMWLLKKFLSLPST